MAIRNATELRNYIYANVKPNANNEITAQIEQKLFIDFVDSFVIGGVLGHFDFSQTSLNITPTGTSLGIPLIADSINGATIIINGQSFDLGETTSDSFYFKRGTSVVIKGELLIDDILNYNSDETGFLIDSDDVIVIKYLI